MNARCPTVTATATAPTANAPASEDLRAASATRVRETFAFFWNHRSLKGVLLLGFAESPQIQPWHLIESSGITS